MANPHHFDVFFIIFIIDCYFLLQIGKFDMRNQISDNFWSKSNILINFYVQKTKILNLKLKFWQEKTQIMAYPHHFDVFFIIFIIDCNFFTSNWKIWHEKPNFW